MNSLVTLASEGPAADTVTPGVLGFIAIASIGAALYFLMKSMRKRLDGIRAEPAETGETGETGGSDAGAEPAGDHGAGTGSAAGTQGTASPSP